MQIDYEFAMIELSADEAARFKSDDDYRAKVMERAQDLADETDRTVEIRSDTLGLIASTAD